MSNKFAITHKGQAFASQGLGKFAKDVVHVGEWIHPVTGQKVKFDQARLQKLAGNTTRYLQAGNKVPFPDGHTFDAMKNLGDWPGPFLAHGDDLVAVCEPKAAGVAQKLADKSIDAVSAYIEFDITDSKGNHYDEVITHVCATPYPVVTEQKEFIKLSGKLPEGAELLLPMGLAAAPADPELEAAVDALALAFQKAAPVQTSAAPEPEALARTFLELAAEASTTP